MWKVEFAVLTVISASLILSVSCADLSEWFQKRPDGPDKVNENVQIVFT
jgi:hypothetical protein